MVVCFGVDQRRPISRPTWPIPLRSDLALLGCADDDVGLVLALGGLALDGWPALRRGVAGRAVLVPGHPEKGTLTARIRGRAKPVMPTDGKPLETRPLANLPM